MSFNEIELPLKKTCYFCNGYGLVYLSGITPRNIEKMPVKKLAKDNRYLCLSCNGLGSTPLSALELEKEESCVV